MRTKALVLAAAMAIAPAATRAQPTTTSGPLTETPPGRDPGTGEMLDWIEGGPRDRHWGRMLLEMAALFGVMEGVYWANKEANKFDFEYEADWRNVRERFITLEAWRLDDNYYETNAWRHTAQGGLNYLFARSNGFSALESYAVSLTQSAIWELLGEYKEEVSVNDVILTPRAGSVVGESMWQLGLFFLRGDRNWGYKIAGNAGTLGKGLFDYLDGKPRPRTGTLGPLGLPADVPHRFEARVAGVRQSAGGQVWPMVRAGIATELILIPDFDRPGTADRVYAAPAHSDLRVEVARDDVSITDFRAVFRTGITSWHKKDLQRDCGYNLMYGLASAYEYGLHVTPERDTRSTRDQIAIGHIGGGTVDLMVRRGRLEVRMAGDLYGDFALLRNYAIDAYRAANPGAPVRSTILRDNYHHALGLTGRARVVASLGAARLGVAYQQDYFRSLQGLDRHQEEIIDDYPLVDTRGEGRAWLSYELPLRPGLALGLEAGLEVRHRTGTVKSVSQSDTETRQVGALQLVF